MAIPLGFLDMSYGNSSLLLISTSYDNYTSDRLMEYVGRWEGWGVPLKTTRHP